MEGKVMTSFHSVNVMKMSEYKNNNFSFSHNDILFTIKYANQLTFIFQIIPTAFRESNLQTSAKKI